MIARPLVKTVRVIETEVAGQSNRVHTARRLLEQLEELGILVLPDKDESKRRGAQKAPAWTARSEPGAEIGGGLEGLEPLELRVVTEPPEVGAMERTDRPAPLPGLPPPGRSASALRHRRSPRALAGLPAVLLRGPVAAVPRRLHRLGRGGPAQAPGPGARQRDAGTPFSSRTGNEPRGGGEIELAPLRLSRLARTDDREHNELEQKAQPRTLSTRGDDERGDFAVRDRRWWRL